MKKKNKQNVKMIGRIVQYRDRMECTYYFPFFDRMISNYTRDYLNSQTRRLATLKNARCIVNSYYVEKKYLDDVTPVKDEDILHEIRVEKRRPMSY